LRANARTRNNTSGASFILKISLVAILEGFSTLAVEVIAIRLATPVAGSSMTLTGVMLGFVLFALSAGYWRGGELSARRTSEQIRTAVARNLLAAGAIYAALSFPAEAWLLEKLLDAGLALGLAIGTTATLLFVLPVYLASQTVPMLAELTNTEGKAGRASGKILFFSTLGSVAGGILTPVFLFPTIGVRISTYLVCGLLAVAAGMAMAGHTRRRVLIPATTLLAAVSVAQAVSNQGKYRFAFDSPHQSIRIVDEPVTGGRVKRVMYLNGGRASGIYTDNGESAFRYVREATQALAASKSESVLAIGAAGFTFPRDAAAMPFVKEVDAVDVDSEVLNIAEEHFLLAPLSRKVRFVPVSARGALHSFRQQGRRFGFTLLDAYSGKGIPEELLTVEFFSDVRSVSNRVAANIIMDPEVESEFARNVLASFRQVFGRVWIKNTDPDDSDVSNVLVTNWDMGGSVEWKAGGRIYTDDRNSGDQDHVKMIWSD
jgi:spermidine synthase